ncbi:Uncharacterized protein FKW44_021445 [Caligus rogercresseyi]|uniref:Uncharacterized protein n=1 Tax=Caligus rogercresseyi TaxID=217165 RepID=A0A7T8JVT8_CALRO|nr:Uncharacterized protein FKW44_021445 [Caligus rogercresseyi]
MIDAHEWLKEIPTVPIYYLAKLQSIVDTLRRLEGRSVIGLVGFATREFNSFSEENLITLFTHDAQSLNTTSNTSLAVDG